MQLKRYAAAVTAEELHRIINDREMRDAIILIFANKQDLPEGEPKGLFFFCIVTFLLRGL